MFSDTKVSHISGKVDSSNMKKAFAKIAKENVDGLIK